MREGRRTFLNTMSLLEAPLRWPKTREEVEFSSGISSEIAYKKRLAPIEPVREKKKMLISAAKMPLLRLALRIRNRSTYNLFT